MRHVARFLLPLLLVTLLFAPAPSARAEDDAEAPDQLQARVAMLLEMVSQLRLEMSQLKDEVTSLQQRVAYLEFELAAAAAGTGGKEPPTATDTDTEVVVIAPDFVGTWVLDHDAFAEEMAARLADQFEGDGAEMMLEMLKQQLANLQISLELHADGTFDVSATGMGSDGSDASGDWVQDGLTIAFTTTVEDGIEKDMPERMSGTWKDGRLHLRPEAEAMDIVLVLKRAD